jgi:hypothetical protein
MTENTINNRPEHDTHMVVKYTTFFCWLPYGRNTAHITHYAETLLTFKNWIAHIVTVGVNTPHLW